MKGPALLSYSISLETREKIILKIYIYSEKKKKEKRKKTFSEFPHLEHFWKQKAYIKKKQNVN